MKVLSYLNRKTSAAVAAIAVAAFALIFAKSGSGQPAAVATATVSTTPSAEPSVELTASQTNAIKVEPLQTRLFHVERTAIGGIDYDEDLSVQVFPSYQGKIIRALALLGDAARKGQPLYTIDSPDLIQAESTLIAAAASHVLYSNELARAKSLFGTNGVSEREMEQATSDEQTSEGTLKAAKDAVRVFGKTDAEIDQVISTRQIDPVLVVASPVTGRVTARNAQPGLLVQPGSSTAPYAVADLTRKWMVANVTESDSPLFHEGQKVAATVMAYPGRVFEGVISRMGAAVDPNTHRVMVRSDIDDPKDELRSGMFATFTIQVRDPVESVSIPVNGVVRNGDGTMAAWVTTDGRRFVQRLVKVALEQDGQYQVLEGLRRGELAVTDGAIFLNNILYAPPSD